MQFLIKSTPQAKRLVFNAIKEKILKHLEELEKQEAQSMQKALSELTGLMFKGGKGLPVGTIREWKGKKFIKTAPGKWKPKYDSHSHGAKLAIAALKKKIAACDDAREMILLVLENRDRFSNKDGNPLPFVQELSRFIEQTQEEKQQGRVAATSTQKKAGQNGGGGSGGGDDGNENDGYPEKDYPEYKGTGQKAVDFIVKQKGGQVRGAFNRPEIGDIDVVWGKVTNAEKHKGYGLAHIIDKHGIEAAKKIGEIIKTGEVYRDNRNRLCIKNNNSEIALKEDWFKHKKIWIVTSYRMDEERAKTITSNSHYTGETLPATSKQSIAQPERKSSGGIADKMEQWKKEGRKIVKDDRGLYFYEGMSPSEKIEWIETEIARLEHENTSLKEKNANQTPDHHTDTMNYYHNGGDQKKLGKYLDDLDSTRKQQRTQQIKENEEEIKQYKEDVDYYAQKTHAKSTTRAIPQQDNKSSKSLLRATLDKNSIIFPNTKAFAEVFAKLKNCLGDKKSVFQYQHIGLIKDVHRNSCLAATNGRVLVLEKIDMEIPDTYDRKMIDVNSINKTNRTVSFNFSNGDFPDVKDIQKKASGKNKLIFNQREQIVNLLTTIIKQQKQDIKNHKDIQELKRCICSFEQNNDGSVSLSYPTVQDGIQTIKINAHFSLDNTNVYFDAESLLSSLQIMQHKSIEFNFDKPDSLIISEEQNTQYIVQPLDSMDYRSCERFYEEAKNSSLHKAIAELEAAYESFQKSMKQPVTLPASPTSETLFVRQKGVKYVLIAKSPCSLLTANGTKSA